MHIFGRPAETHFDSFLVSQLAARKSGKLYSMAFSLSELTWLRNEQSVFLSVFTNNKANYDLFEFYMKRVCFIFSSLLLIRLLPPPNARGYW